MLPTMNATIAKLEQAGLGDILLLSSNPRYDQRIESYWSHSSKQRPWALLQPRNTQEVSQAVKTIVGIPDVRFAIRSGGHLAVTGSNNVEDGITIDLGCMDKTTYNYDNGLASIQPGARWIEVYQELEKHGVMVAGGRVADVGVGGFLTGGGLSYHNCRMGFSCDTVVRYEVVLGDGSIIEADKEKNPDLFRSLKGCGNNFAVVTRFDMETFENKTVWGGFATFPDTAGPDLLDGFVTFMHGVSTKSDGTVIMMWTYDSLQNDTLWTTIIAGLDVSKNKDLFGHFIEIPSTLTSLSTTTMAKITTESIVPPGKFNTWYTTTTKFDERVIKRFYSETQQLIQEMSNLNISKQFTISFCQQALLRSTLNHSAAKGGNMLGLDDGSEDLVIFLFMGEFETVQFRDAAIPFFQKAMDQLDMYAESINLKIDWKYLNYCGITQNPISTYGQSNITKMIETSARYDPYGVFQKRVVGGFKLPNA